MSLPKENLKGCYFIEKSGLIEEVGEAFIELTGFTRDDFLNRTSRAVFKDLLRIREKPASLDKQTQAYIFTRSLEPREVVINVSRYDNTRVCIIREIPGSRIAEKFPYINSLCLTNVQGVAIFAITEDIVLLQANQAYLDFLDTPYNKMENTIGKSIDEFITGWKGSTSEKIWEKVLSSCEYYYNKEYIYDRFERGITYWKATLMPIIEDGTVKYAIEVTEEITESVMNKYKIEEQATIITQQKEQLEQIIEHIPDAMVVFDSRGNVLKKNAEARKMYPDMADGAGKIHEGYKYFDLEGNTVKLESLPARRAFNGERVRNERIVIKGAGSDRVAEISATPVFDGKGELQWVINSHRDITEYAEGQQRLLNTEIERNETLEASIRLKDEFLYLITHEFRTPMAVVNSALQMINSIYKNEITDNIRKHLNIIKQNTNRQLRLVNNLLDISRIRAGNIKLDLRPFDIIYLTKAIINSVEVYAKQKDVNITFKSNEREKRTLLDEEKYERIMLNLLANALKFTPKGRNIHVSINIKGEKDMETACIIVKDEGIGIPDDKKQTIFDRFGQVDSSLSRQAEGTGLGLHLVKLLVNALGGMITLESKLNKGSAFTIMLPLRETRGWERTVVTQASHQLVQSCERIIQSAAIEFSDIYL